MITSNMATGCWLNELLSQAADKFIQQGLHQICKFPIIKYGSVFDILLDLFSYAQISEPFKIYVIDLSLIGFVDLVYRALSMYFYFCRFGLQGFIDVFLLL